MNSTAAVLSGIAAVLMLLFSVLALVASRKGEQKTIWLVTSGIAFAAAVIQAISAAIFFNK